MWVFVFQKYCKFWSILLSHFIKHKRLFLKSVIPSAFILWSFLIRLFNYLQICSLLRGGIAERGGVRVGHRIIEINGQSVVAVPHEKIVNLLATSVGEVRIVYTMVYFRSKKKVQQSLLKIQTIFFVKSTDNLKLFVRIPILN